MSDGKKYLVSGVVIGFVGGIIVTVSIFWGVNIENRITALGAAHNNLIKALSQKQSPQQMTSQQVKPESE
jgi:hypothetical protein